MMKRTTPIPHFATPFPVAVLRQTTAGAYGVDDGKWRDGKKIKFSITADVQPLPGSDLQMLPEGDRAKESVTIFTQMELKIADVACGNKADIVLYKGKRFEVTIVLDWTGTDLPHYRCIAVKVPDGA